MGPRAGLEGRKISSPPGFNPEPPARSSVAIPTELPGPHTHTHTICVCVCVCVNRVAQFIYIYKIEFSN